MEGDGFKKIKGASGVQKKRGGHEQEAKLLSQESRGTTRLTKRRKWWS